MVKVVISWIGARSEERESWISCPALVEKLYADKPGEDIIILN